MCTKGFPSHTFKMILLGEYGSGKTCLFHRIVYNHYRDSGTYDKKFYTNTTPTTGGGVHYENHTKEVELSGNIRVRVFDTGGAERAKSMTQQYYKNADIVCLVYSIDSEISFNALGRWIEDAKLYLEGSHRHSKVVYALVGIKSDIPLYEREVKPGDVKKAAKHFNISFCFEVCNISGDNITEMMQCLVQNVYDLHTRPVSTCVMELQETTEYMRQHSITKDGVTFKDWLCYCLCCCGICSRRREYQPLTSTRT